MPYNEKTKARQNLRNDVSWLPVVGSEQERTINNVLACPIGKVAVESWACDTIQDYWNTIALV